MIQVMKDLANNNINVKSAGLLAFVKQREKDKLDCKYRITYFGALLLSQIINTQKINFPKELKNLFVNIVNKRKIKFEALSKDEKIIIEVIKRGIFIISYENIDIVMRKGKNSIHIMIPEIYLKNIEIYVNKYIISE
jgi:hypothetical protein